VTSNNSASPSSKEERVLVRGPEAGPSSMSGKEESGKEESTSTSTRTGSGVMVPERLLEVAAGAQVVELSNKELVLVAKT
jgi:hypothetical protein